MDYVFIRAVARSFDPRVFWREQVIPSSLTTLFLGFLLGILFVGVYLSPMGASVPLAEITMPSTWVVKLPFGFSFTMHRALFFPVLFLLIFILPPAFYKCFQTRVPFFDYLRLHIWVGFLFCILLVPVVLLIGSVKPPLLSVVIVFLSLILFIWMTRQLHILTQRYWALCLAVIFLVGSLSNSLTSSTIQALAKLYNISYSSMAPALEPGDRLWVDVQAYTQDSPATGDVIVFETSGPQPMILVKRVIAGPGSFISVVDGVPVVDDRPLSHKIEGVYEIDVSRYPPEKRPVSQRTMIRESYTEALSWSILDEAEIGVYDNFDSLQLGADDFFVLGDNRDMSRDSRSPGFGAVKRSRIKGRVVGVVKKK